MQTDFFIQRPPRRLSTALLLSLAVHALLLSVTLGGHSYGLPGLNLPWKERRLGADDLRVSLAPARSPAAPTAPVTTTLDQPRAASATVRTPGAARRLESTTESSRTAMQEKSATASRPRPTNASTLAAPASPSKLAIAAQKRPDVNLPLAPAAPAVRATPAASAVRASPASMEQDPPEQVEEVKLPVDFAQMQDVQDEQDEPDTQKQTLEQATLAQEKQRAARLQQEALVADAQREAARQEQLRQDASQAEQTASNEAARMEGERQALARQNSLRQEALRQERARQDEQAQQDATRQELAKAEAARQDALKQETIRQELARAEAARQEAQKQETARQDSARQEQAQQNVARQELARAEAARQDGLKQELARQERARQEQARQDTARQELAKGYAARQELARADAARQERARQEQAQQDAARQEAAHADAARQDAAKQAAAQKERAAQEQSKKELAEQEAKREERLRAIGKQLNEEATQRDAALNRPSSALPSSIGSARRGWLFGRADPNADLVQYADAMSQKIEKDIALEKVSDVVKQPHTRPIVTVAVRADGSVEKVTFVVSSGVPAIDESIRKIVASQAPYGAFPPNLMRQYDVVEIRRTWIFDVAIRLE